MTFVRPVITALWTLACLVSAASAQARGVTKASILIGQSSAFSGSNKELGDDIREGIQAYFKQANAAGGINGRTLELVALDDANDAKRSGENARVLIEQRGVLALIGYASARLRRPALPLAEKSKIAFVGPFTGAEPMRSFRRNVYNIRASYADELEKIVDFYTTTGMKKFSVIHYDDAVGKENLAAVEVALTKRGLKTASIGTLKRNQTDLGATVSEVVTAAPDVVIATTLYKTTGDFIKSAKKAGSNAQFASTSFVGASALASELGDQGTGVVVAQVVPPFARTSVPIVREYQAAIEKSLGKKEYSFTSLEAYIGAKVLFEAIRRAAANPTREGLLKTLDSMQNFNVGGYLVDFSASNHNGSKFVELTAISKAGRFAY